MATLDETFSLYQKDILNKKLLDRAWFLKCIAYNYSSVAKDYNCYVQISARRLGEAYDFWQEDTDRALSEGSDHQTKELDQFKHASFITFWLRRLCPINEAFIDHSFPDGTARANPSADQAFFLRYGNELCAFVVGWQLCQFYHVMDLEDKIADSGGGVSAIRSSTFKQLNQWSLDRNLLADFVMILKHKNISPQAIYITFRALFSS